VKSLMFTFNDLQRLSPGAMQVLLRSIEKDRLPIALKGTSEMMKNLFLSQLSERAGKMLRDDMAALGPVKMKDVEDAQSAITTVAKELAAAGEIEISANTDDKVIE
jgi:flagellar motor switch protein FliG